MNISPQPAGAGSTAHERARVVEALRKYGYQSQCYNVLLPDKSYYFSRQGIDGVIPYVTRAGVALVAGDPLCRASDTLELVSEFTQFCRNQGWRCGLQAITQRCRNGLHGLRFGYLKIGEEPFFRLAEFSLAGGRFRNLRRDIRRAEADGVTVVEYRPSEGRQPSLESQMAALSEAWRKMKGSGEFSFLVGRPDLDDPGDRKYFVAVKDEVVEAFVVCTPIYARNGVYFDLLRRKDRPIRGTVELLITSAFRLLAEQGYELATLGTAPLSNEHVRDPKKRRVIGVAMDLAFDHLGYFYRFKPVYEFKDQFGPHFWEPRYLAYYPARFHPVLIYAVLKAYDPAAVSNLLRQQVQAAWDGVRWLARAPEEVVEAVVALSARSGRMITRRRKR